MSKPPCNHGKAKWFFTYLSWSPQLKAIKQEHFQFPAAEEIFADVHVWEYVLGSCTSGCLIIWLHVLLSFSAGSKCMSPWLSTMEEKGKNKKLNKCYLTEKEVCDTSQLRRLVKFLLFRLKLTARFSDLTSPSLPCLSGPLFIFSVSFCSFCQPISVSVLCPLPLYPNCVCPSLCVSCPFRLSLSSRLTLLVYMQR